MSSAINDNSDTNKTLNGFTNNILHSDTSIRWVGIIDANGITIKEQYRKGLNLLLTEEETHEFAKNTITRYKTRLKLEPKMGKLTYLFRRYTKLSRCIIPINDNYYLLLTMDFEENDFDKIIMEKIIPIINKEKENFIIREN
jgi:hypothetical protein